MAKKETTSPAIPVFPMLKTVEQMSKISGIGENKLRELMDSGELEYIQNGNRRLIADAAIWDWYHRAKTTAKPPARQAGVRTEILPQGVSGESRMPLSEIFGCFQKRGSFYTDMQSQLSSGRRHAPDE